jgi:hypothetical protein
MLNFIAVDAPAGSTDKRKYSYPYLSSEILSDEITTIRARLMSEESLGIILGFFERSEKI